jgi:hypothetical protein
MSTTKIGHMSLKNDGGFVVKIRYRYFNGTKLVDTDTRSRDIDLGQTGVADPANHGVPEGAVVYLYADVVGGDDNVAKNSFVFERWNPNTAQYVISGTTLNNDLGFIGVANPNDNA